MVPADIFNLHRYRCTDGRVRTVLSITDAGLLDYRIDGADDLVLAVRTSVDDFSAAAVELVGVPVVSQPVAVRTRPLPPGVTPAILQPLKAKCDPAEMDRLHGDFDKAMEREANTPVSGKPPVDKEVFPF
jgi:hypothetical protein